MVRTRPHELRTDEQELREVEATVTVLITEELVAQHELGAHPEPVSACPTCRAHRYRPERSLPFSA